MFGMRLEKLEKDLTLLSAMQNLLLQSEVTENSIAKSNPLQKTYNRKQNNSSTSNKNSCGGTCKKNLSRQNCTKCSCYEHLNNGTKCKVLTNETKAGGPEINERISFVEEEKVEDLETKFQLERERLIEIEEAGRSVTAKLYKTEEELHKETNVKKSLILETVQLKNEIQHYIERVRQLEVEIRNSKQEHLNCKQHLEILNKEKSKLQEEFYRLTVEFEKNCLNIKHENEDLKSKLEDLKCQLGTAKQNEFLEKETINEATKKYREEIDTYFKKCALLENEKLEQIRELRTVSAKAESTESKLLLVQTELLQLQSRSNQENAQQQSLLQKSKKHLKDHKELVSNQINQCFSLISKSKVALSQLYTDKLQLKADLQAYKKENERLISQLRNVNGKLFNLQKNENLHQTKINSIISQNMDRIVELQNENVTLKCQLKQEKVDSERRRKHAKELEVRFQQDKEKIKELCRIEKDEKENLVAEVSRLQDNFNVLQKINQDNAQTISKLRGELEQTKKIQSENEKDLADKFKNEEKLGLRLEERELVINELEDQVEFLHNQLRMVETQMEEHNCEQQVESVYKSKLLKLENQIKSQTVEWKETLDGLKVEKNEAIAAARKSKELAEKLKLEFEARMTKIISTAKNEVLLQREKYSQEKQEYKTKISELERDLEHVRSQSTQIHRTLSNRIHQLQCALTTTTLCLSSSSSNCTNNNGIVIGTSSPNVSSEAAAKFSCSNINGSTFQPGVCNRTDNRNPFLES